MDEGAIMGLAEGLVRAVFLEASTAFTPVSCTCRFIMSRHSLPACSSPEHPHPLLEVFPSLATRHCSTWRWLFPCFMVIMLCLTTCWNL